MKTPEGGSACIEEETRSLDKAGRCASILSSTPVCHQIPPQHKSPQDESYPNTNDSETPITLKEPPTATVTVDASNKGHVTTDQQRRDTQKDTAADILNNDDSLLTSLITSDENEITVTKTIIIHNSNYHIANYKATEVAEEIKNPESPEAAKDQTKGKVFTMNLVSNNFIEQIPKTTVTA